MAAGHVIVPGARGPAVAFYAALGASVGTQIFYIKANELIGANRRASGRRATLQALRRPLLDTQGSDRQCMITPASLAGEVLN